MGESRDSSQRAWVMAAVDEHEQPLVRFAARLLGDEEAARDAVQHAFLKLCSADRERIGRDVRKWLFAAVRHKALDMRRRQGRQDELDDETLDGMVDVAGDPADALEQRELGEHLLALVETLSGAQRETVLLWLEGHRSVDIAAITGRSDSTVRVHLHNALKALRGHPSVQALLEAEEAAALGGEDVLASVPSRRDESA